MRLSHKSDTESHADIYCQFDLRSLSLVHIMGSLVHHWDGMRIMRLALNMIPHSLGLYLVPTKWACTS